MMKAAHFAILDWVMAKLSGPDWQTVPMTAHVDGEPRQWAPRMIPGRRARLKELSDLGLLHVRTVTIAAWYSPLSDPLEGGRSGVEVQAMLTPQGRDVALSRRPDGVSAKGGL